MEELAKFPSRLVVSEAKIQLNVSSRTTGEIVRLLLILGTYGASSDAQAVYSFLNVGNEPIRNASDETRKLLVDPLRVAQGWREMLVD